MTITSVARKKGALVGSVYERFLSRDVLLAEIWLKIVSSFQEAFLQLLEKGEGLEAALHTLRWVRLHPAEAGLSFFTDGKN